MSMTVKKEKLKDGSIRVTCVFVSGPKDSAGLSQSGKMLLGYSSGFRQVSETEGDKINIVYGWNAQAQTKPKTAQEQVTEL